MSVIKLCGGEEGMADEIAEIITNGYDPGKAKEKRDKSDDRGICHHEIKDEVFRYRN